MTLPLRSAEDRAWPAVPAGAAAPADIRFLYEWRALPALLARWTAPTASAAELQELAHRFSRLLRSPGRSDRLSHLQRHYEAVVRKQAAAVRRKEALDAMEMESIEESAVDEPIRMVDGPSGKRRARSDAARSAKRRSHAHSAGDDDYTEAEAEGDARRSSSECKSSSEDEDDSPRALLKHWFLKHARNPYPTATEKAELRERTGMSKKQLSDWFINMRKRHWTPLKRGSRPPASRWEEMLLDKMQRWS